MAENSNDPEDIVEAKLPGNHRAYIHRTDESLHFDEPVYAVNWFNAKSRWIYDFYNLLASGSVKAVGGAPFFKGRLIKKLHGTESDSREIVLVVRYPGLNKFKAMLESTYFQLVSILRLLAVKEFTFGFTKRCDEDAPLNPHSAASGSFPSYMVHHFKGNPSIADELVACCHAAAVDPVFAGIVGAVVGTGTSPSDDVITPCLMDAVVIFKAPDRTAAEALSRSTRYQAAMSKTSSSFIGLYDRVM